MKDRAVCGENSEKKIAIPFLRVLKEGDRHEKMERPRVPGQYEDLT